MKKLYWVVLALIGLLLVITGSMVPISSPFVASNQQYLLKQISPFNFLLGPQPVGIILLFSEPPFQVMSAGMFLLLLCFLRITLAAPSIPKAVVAKPMGGRRAR